MHKARKGTGTNKGPYRLEPLPPKEAIKQFGGRTVLSAQEFYDLQAAARASAFTVSGVTRAEVLNDIYDAAGKGLQNGETLADFRARLHDIMVEKGWVGLTPSHAENVFRTILQTDYNVGRWQQFQKVKSDFYLEYDDINDIRLCEICGGIAAKLKGKVYPVDHPIWDIFAPLQHFQCRCGLRPVHRLEAESRGLEIADEIPPDMPVPIEGFAVNPAKVGYQPDLSKFPEELQGEMKNEGLK